MGGPGGDGLGGDVHGGRGLGGAGVGGHAGVLAEVPVGVRRAPARALPGAPGVHRAPAKALPGAPGVRPPTRRWVDGGGKGARRLFPFS